jgi:NAD(P)-dependent dehydrogenase (short-subunit alcohol dehydrogenase family)
MTVGVVVGATGGIGSACARALATAADTIVLTGRNEHLLGDVTAALGARAKAVIADLTEPADRERIAAAVDSSEGELEWVVVASGMPLRATLEALSSDEIVTAFTVNLVAPTLLIRRLLDCRWTPAARIVVIGSISAARALPNRSVYGASKAGIEHFARALAAEVAGRGIRVNVVAPGVVETPFLGDDAATLQDWVHARVPVARLGTPDEVAAVTRYLVVEAPDFMTAARVVVDGGAEIRL